MYQYYVVEIQKNTQGEYAHLVHYVWDEDKDKARLKGESKYHEVLSTAAVSQLPEHGAILISSDCVPLENKCYKKAWITAE